MDSLWKEFLGLAVSLQGQVWLGLEEKDMNSADPLFTLRGLGALGLSTSSGSSPTKKPCNQREWRRREGRARKKPPNLETPSSLQWLHSQGLGQEDASAQMLLMQLRQRLGQTGPGREATLPGDKGKRQQENGGMD